MEPYLAEIRMTSVPFAPKGWALCHGQLLPINQNQALFALLGTTYGGNGMTTFALPNLRGRVPVHAAGGVTLGQTPGAETHTLTEAQMPAHRHAPRAGGTADATDPAGARWAATDQPHYGPSPQVVTASSSQPAGGGQAHPNMPPYLGVHFIIALQGIFPSPN